VAVPADPAVPPAAVFAALAVPLAVVLPEVPLQDESSVAPPAAAANRRNARRPGDARTPGLPGSPLSLPVSAIAVRLPVQLLHRRHSPV